MMMIRDTQSEHRTQNRVNLICYGMTKSDRHDVSNKDEFCQKNTNTAAGPLEDSQKFGFVAGNKATCHS
ncbi:MAG: hypothetical protein AB8B94_11190 [Hyphomicrobiales bacterium]